MSTIYVNNILPATGDTSTVSGSFKITGSMQVTGNVFMAGNLTVDGTTTTVNSTTVNITSSITFEGPADAHETTFGIVDPTADATINLPAMSAGTYHLPVLAVASTTAVSSTPEELNLLDGSSAGTVVNSKGVIYSSGGAVVTSIVDGGATVTLSGSTDVRVENDLRLDSDSSIISMGKQNDVTITHDGTTGVTIAATPISINSTGNLTLDSTTDIVLSGSSEVRVENDLRLDSDSAVFSMGAGDDFTITHDGTTGVTIKGDPIVVQKAATTAAAHQEIIRLEIKDEGVDMNIGNGPGIDFYVGETGGSNYGGTVAVIREVASDADSDAAMVFHTATDDQVPSTDRERMRITSAGKIGIGLTSPSTALTVSGSITLAEQAAADSDTTALGQLWVKNATPNQLYYTTDAGDDIQITSGTSLASTGDITGVTAGDGLSGGGTSGGVTVAVEAAQTTITSILATDLKIGEDNQTKIDFETADEIHFYAANVEQVYVADNIFGPQSDSDVDLGTTGVRWKDAYVDSVTVTGDVSVGDDLSLASDSAVFNMGVGNDFTITHDGTTGATLAGTPISINSTGNLTLDSSTDIVLSGSSEVRVENDLRLDSDSSVISLGAQDDVTITHDGTTGATIAANPLTLDGAATITLSGSTDVRVENNLRLDSDSSVISMGKQDDATFTHDGTTGLTIAANPLTLDGTATITLSGSTDVRVENDLRLDSDSSVISLGAQDDVTLTHDGTTGLTIAATPISIDATGELHLNSTTGDIKFQDGGTDQLALDLDGTAGEVIMKLMVDADDFVFKQYDGTEVFRVEDNGAFDIAGGVGSTGVTVTSAGAVQAAGRITSDNTTNATSTTDGSIQTDGGLSVVLDAVIGDDLFLLSDSAVFNMGLGNDFTITHDGTTGATLAGTPISINSTGNLTLDSSADIVLSGSSEVRVENDLRLDSDSSIISMGKQDDFTITHDGTTGATIAANPLTIDGTATITLSGSTDVRVENDLRLDSDSSVISMGKQDDVTFTHDGTTGLTIAANPFEVDSGGNITLDSHTGIFIFQDANSEVLRFTEGNSGDVTVKLETNGKDLIFTDNGDAEGFRILDAAAGVKVPGEVRTTGIAFTDGDDAITIADGGGVTFSQTVKLVDDKTLTFGSNDDVTIEYDEDGTDALLITGDTFTYASANASDPLIQIFNSTDDANGSRLRFVKNRGAGAGQANDVIGLLEFISHDAGSNDHLFAEMKAEIAVATEGQEGGKLSLGVVTHDGETQYGLVIQDGNAEDEIDATIGNGAASMTTVSGDLTVTGADIVIGADADGTDRTVVFGHTTLKTIMGIDDSADTFILNTDDAFDSTIANNSLSIDANHKMIVGGSLRPKGQLHFQMAGYNGSGAGDRFLPWYNVADTNAPGSCGEENMLQMPLPGRIVRVVWKPFNEQSGGDSRVKIYRVQDGTQLAGAGNLTEFVDLTCSGNAATHNIFNTSGSSHFAAGDSIAVSIDPQSTPGDVSVSVIFEYNTTDLS
jgi:hypothetical protein